MRAPPITVWTIAIFAVCAWQAPENLNTLTLCFLCYWLGLIDSDPRWRS